MAQMETQNPNVLGSAQGLSLSHKVLLAQPPLTGHKSNIPCLSLPWRELSTAHTQSQAALCHLLRNVGLHLRTAFSHLKTPHTECTSPSKGQDERGLLCVGLHHSCSTQMCPRIPSQNNSPPATSPEKEKFFSPKSQGSLEPDPLNPLKRKQQKSFCMPIFSRGILQ